MTDVIAEPQRRSNAHLINRIRLIEGDLTRQTDVDAIVVAIPESLDVSGSLNQALISAAGQQVDQYILENIFRPRAGDVFVLPGYNLPVKNIILAVVPKWKDALEREDRDLSRCYRGTMHMAVKMNIRKIAFPALGTGRKSFPVRRAARLAIHGILDRMTDSVEEVRIVCNRPDQYEAFHEWLVHFGWVGPAIPLRQEGIKEA